MSRGEETSGKVAVEGEDSVADELEETTDVLSLPTAGKWVASSAKAGKGVAWQEEGARDNCASLDG